MIDYLKYRMKLGKLFRQKEQLHSSFAEDIRKAQKEGKGTNDRKSLEHQAWFEHRMIDEEISILLTSTLVRKAN